MTPLVSLGIFLVLFSLSAIGVSLAAVLLMHGISNWLYSKKERSGV